MMANDEPENPILLEMQRERGELAETMLIADDMCASEFPETRQVGEQLRADLERVRVECGLTTV